MISPNQHAHDMRYYQSDKTYHTGRIYYKSYN